MQGIENRPAMRLDQLNVDEVISYARSYGVTYLEKELLKHLEAQCEALEVAYEDGKNDGMVEAEALAERPDVCQNCGAQID